MGFKLQLTDEMIRFIRQPSLSHEHAGVLVRLLIDVAEGKDLPDDIPQPLTYTLPIFAGQIEAFRESYLRKIAQSAERVRRCREKEMKRITSVTDVTSVTSVTCVTDTCNACNAPNQTKPDQTKPDQFNPSGTDRTDRRPIGVNSYDDIYDPANNPIDIALTICQEQKPRMAAAGYIRQYQRIGDNAFRVELASYWGELEAGEIPRNRGSALMARLQRIEDYNPEEAAEVRRLCEHEFDGGKA